MRKNVIEWSQSLALLGRELRGPWNSWKPTQQSLLYVPKRHSCLRACKIESAHDWCRQHRWIMTITPAHVLPNWRTSAGVTVLVRCHVEYASSTGLPSAVLEESQVVVVRVDAFHNGENILL